MILASQLGGSKLTMACFAGLLGSEAWALLDTIGAQFLWWTWHGSEPLYADREGGVPVASSFWILSSMASLAVTLPACPSSHPMWSVLAGPGATLGLMHVPFLVLYHPLVTAGGLHACYAMWALRLSCLAPLVRRLATASFTPTTPTEKKTAVSTHGGGARDRAPQLHLAVYAITISLVAVLANPVHETRASFGQPCVRAARCAEQESSFWGGFTRGAYVCADDADGLYRVCDARCARAKEPLEFYTTCGVPKRGRDFDALVLCHALAVLLLSALPLWLAPRGVEVKERKE